MKVKDARHLEYNMVLKCAESQLRVFKRYCTSKSIILDIVLQLLISAIFYFTFGNSSDHLPPNQCHVDAHSNTTFVVAMACDMTELAGYAIEITSIFVSIIINMFISHANLACRNKKECCYWVVVHGMSFVRPTISN